MGHLKARLFFPACVIPKLRKRFLLLPFHKSIVIILCLNQMEEYIKKCF